MTNKEKAIQLIEAYYEDKDIEMKDPSAGVPNWININNHQYWSYMGEFLRHLSCYRIKPEDKYRSYSNIAEFTIASKEHGPYIIYPNGNMYIPNIIKLGENEAPHLEVNVPAYNKYTFTELYTNCRWQDGSKCGIIVNPICAFKE